LPTELNGEAGIGTSPGDVLKLNDTAFCCSISICSADGRAFAVCFESDVIEGLLMSLGNTSGCTEESGLFLGNTVDGAVVGEILFGHVPVHFEADGIYLLKDEVCLGLNGCTADARGCSTVGCTDMRS
jgi:hypothetical protein